MGSVLKRLWDYKAFVYSSIKAEYNTRYARSKFGFMWMLIHPLAQVMVYALILSQIMQAKLPGIVSDYSYPIYMLAGILAWTLFSEILNRSLTVFIDNAELLKKISFPKLALPAILVGSAIINYLLLLTIIIIVFISLGHHQLQYLYWIPVLSVITILLAMGIGLFFGILNVFIRDIGHVMSVVLQFWFWLTPIVYTQNIIPEQYQELLLYNPMTGIVMGYQNIMVFGKSPDLDLLLYPVVVMLIFLALSIFVYKKASSQMVDIL
jgi:lipopolysaccharide transport system permease protein